MLEVYCIYLYRRCGRTFYLYFQGDWIFSGECFSISHPEDRHCKNPSKYWTIFSLYDVKTPK